VSDQTLAEQHAAAAGYLGWLYNVPPGGRLPALDPTAATGGNVADGGTHGGGETCG
jgi:hypothetical protein